MLEALIYDPKSTPMLLTQTDTTRDTSSSSLSLAAQPRYILKLLHTDTTTVARNCTYSTFALTHSLSYHTVVRVSTDCLNIQYLWVEALSEDEQLHMALWLTRPLEYMCHRRGIVYFPSPEAYKQTSLVTG